MSGSRDERKPMPAALLLLMVALLWWAGAVQACGGSALEGAIPGDAVAGADTPDTVEPGDTGADGADVYTDTPEPDTVPADIPDDTPDDGPDAGDPDAEGDDSHTDSDADDNPVDPACVGLVDGAPCDDGNPCTSNDTCNSGRCLPTAPTLCDDGNPCTDDRCDPRSGCVYDANLAPCDDGNPCTSNDICRARTCIGGPPTCDDRNPCTRDSCDAAGVCTFVPDDSLRCEDGSDCTSNDFCSNGFCIGGLGDGCDTGSPCATGTCAADNRRCDIVLNDGNACDDGNACTDGDTCSGGQCRSGGPRDCGWDTGCADFRCDPLSGCVLTRLFAARTPCDDNNRCTADSACNASGRCIAGTVVTCNDQNPCTTDGCLPDRGCQHLATDGAVCDDGSACTTNDRCFNATCNGTQRACNDGDACTLDRCDPLIGCVSTPVLCDDGNPCTTDRCGAAGVCVFEPVGGPCDDGKTCTTNDRCDGGTCVGTNACDDADPCTRDFCDAEEGCVFVPFTGACDDGNACTVGEMCNSNGVCGGGQTLVPIDDGIACTDDLCTTDPAGLHVPVPSRCGDGEGCSTTDGCGDAAGRTALTRVVVAFPDPDGGADILVQGLLVSVAPDFHVDLGLHHLRYGNPAQAWPLLALDAAQTIPVDPGAPVLLLDAGPPLPPYPPESLPARLVAFFGVPGDLAASPGDDDVIELLSPNGRVLATTSDDPDL